MFNGIDGTTASEGRLLFMTANSRDKLDEALIRSGRIDYELEFKPVDREQIMRSVGRVYYNGVDPTIPAGIADIIRNS